MKFLGGDRFEGALTLKTGVNYTSYGTGRATISGGVPVTTWTQVDAPHNIWRASWNAGRPRALFVNGVRVKRARTTSFISGTTENGTGYGTGSSSSPGYMSTWGNKSDIEMVYYFSWRNSFSPVSTVVGNTITMLSTPFAELVANQTGLGEGWTPDFVENAYEIFTANNTAGTFYQDRTANFVYLIPPSGGDPNSMTVIAPVLQQICNGTSVSNVTVSNLVFEHTTNTDINTAGFPDVQGTICGDVFNAFTSLRNLSGAIYLTACTDVTFVRCIVRRLGNTGIQVNSTCTNCAIVGNIIYDISGNGITVGGSLQYTGSQPVGLQVNNNAIALVAQEYQGAVAFFQWWAVRSNISYNEVWDIPYTGISLGIGWARETNPNGSTGNIISFNEVHDFMQVMDDGGGVYLNSRGPSTFVLSNYIHDTGSFGTKMGTYMDDGSFGFNAWDNVMVQCYTNPMYFHDNISNNSALRNTSDGGAYGVANGVLYVADNTYDTLNVVSTPTARAAGVALGTGIQAAYADVKTEAHILIP